MKAASISSLLLITLFSTFSTAQAEEKRFIPQSTLEEAVNAGGGTETVKLATGDIYLARDRSGVVGISHNGRYKFTGAIFDTWAEKEIDTLAAAEHSKTHIPLNALDLTPKIVQAFTLGFGEKEIYAFVSPDDAASREFLKAVQRLGRDYTFHVIPVPSQNTDSDLALAYSCPTDRQQAVEVLFAGGTAQDIDQDPSCTGEILAARLIVFQMLGLYELPAIIMPSDKLLTGQPKEGWIEAIRNN